MKQIIIIGFVLIGILLIAGCENKPQPTAKTFLTALEKREFDTAKQYVAHDSQQYLTIMKDNFAKLSPAEKEANTWKYEITEVQSDGSNARTSYVKTPKQPDNGTGTDANKSLGEMKLVTENFKWKVVIGPDTVF